MTYLKVRIIRLWDLDWYPGFAECVMTDASGAEHLFRDKIPVFSARTLTPDDLPCEGAIRCTTVAEHADGAITVDIELPDYIESETGEHLFRVLPNQLTDGEVFHE